MAAAGGLATLAGIAALCGAGPLDILLTNDDGTTATGIRALRAQLVTAGHRVTIAAPDHNASGSSMSFNWGTVRVTPDPDDLAVFAVGASPATAVVLAATALYPAGRGPDLVISGINQYRAIYSGIIPPVISPPAPGGPPVETQLQVTLTYSRRPRARYGLAAPAVVFVLIAPIETTIQVALATSHRGRIKSVLGSPQVVFSAVELFLTGSRTHSDQPAGHDFSPLCRGCHRRGCFARTAHQACRVVQRHSQE